MAKSQASKGGKVPLPEPTEESDLEDTADESPQAKSKPCEVCNEPFAFQGVQSVCGDCTQKMQRRRAKHAGYVTCKVVGNVVAQGFVGDDVKTDWIDGSEGEFAQADVDSLPENLLPSG